MLDGVQDDVGHRALDRGAVTGRENRYPSGSNDISYPAEKRHRREIDDDAARDGHEIDFLER